MTIDELVTRSHDNARHKGWYDLNPQRTFGDDIALLHSEASEALEEYRDGHRIDEIYFSVDKDGKKKPEGIPIELADLLIRIAQMCGRYEINLNAALSMKMDYNATRPRQHGGKRI